MKADVSSNGSVDPKTAVEVLAAAGMDAAQLRRDLDEAWNNRRDVVDGDTVFAKIAAKSREVQGK